MILFLFYPMPLFLKISVVLVVFWGVVNIVDVDIMILFKFPFSVVVSETAVINMV